MGTGQCGDTVMVNISFIINKRGLNSPYYLLLPVIFVLVRDGRNRIRNERYSSPKSQQVPRNNEPINILNNLTPNPTTLRQISTRDLREEKPPTSRSSLYLWSSLVPALHGWNRRLQCRHKAVDIFDRWSEEYALRLWFYSWSYDLCGYLERKWCSIRHGIREDWYWTSR